ncbi:response regulator [Maribrevibacterium harenarium]|uniref:histidine kinase n=1 Tax=Maribrevibacterium harenarium TaxID=2589817 RepID=A0A501X2H6_9GAMM|nr:response regulator [Maribrevibacterium harenarium]TPE54688.1 response regulator [Maribrevibacterium harenarium]
MSKDFKANGVQLARVKAPVLIPLAIAFVVVWLAFVSVVWLWLETGQQRALEEMTQRFDDQLFQSQSSMVSQMEERIGLLSSVIEAASMEDKERLVERLLDESAQGLQLSRLLWLQPNGESHYEYSLSALPTADALNEPLFENYQWPQKRSGLILMAHGEMALRVILPISQNDPSLGVMLADLPFNKMVSSLARALDVYANVLVNAGDVDENAMKSFGSGSMSMQKEYALGHFKSLFASDALTDVTTFVPVLEDFEQRKVAGQLYFLTGFDVAEITYDLAVLPVLSADGDDLAYVLMVKDSSQVELETFWVQAVVTGIALVIAAILLVLFYFLLGRIERRIQSGEMTILQERDRSESLRMNAESLREEAELHREAAESARDAAEKASAVKSEFLAKMSHELRTPLNAIIGLSEMMHEDAKEFGDDDYVEPLERVIRSSKHLLNLINEILDISKIEAGKMELHNEQVNFDALLEDVAATARPLIQNKPIELKLELEKIGTVYGDPTRIKQILLNLMSNAAKFTDSGSVTLSAQMLEETISVAIKDTGPGMSEEQMATLFADFVQLDSKSNRKHEGTGLGLAISRKFARMMGGDISVASREGEGSCFTVHLPLPRSEGGVKPLAPFKSSTTQRTILIIEDDDVCAKLISKHFAKNFRLLYAKDGVEALRIARDEQVDLITLDVEMPLLNGWDTLAAIKADKALADIPVVIISVDDDKTRGFALGVDDYVIKPIGNEDMQRILGRFHSVAVERSLDVLLVDDSGEIRIAARRILEKSGATVREAGNGIEALARVNERKPDFVLLDLMMPQMDGFEFLDTLRNSDAFKELPVYVMTAMTLTDVQKRLLERQASAVLSKGGAGVDSLFNRIQGLVAKDE